MSPGEAMLADRSSLPFDWLAMEDDGEAFAALRALPDAGKQSLFAACAARTVKGQLAFEHGARPELEATVARLGIDFAAHVRPTAELFWSRLRKDRMLAIARDTIGVEWASAHRKDKKATLAAAMEGAFAAGDVPVGVTAEGRAAALAWAPPGFHAFDLGRIDDGEDGTAEADPAPAEPPATGTLEETATDPANSTDDAAAADTPSPDADPAPDDSPQHTSVVESIDSPAVAERLALARARQDEANAPQRRSDRRRRPQGHRPDGGPRRRRERRSAAGRRSAHAAGSRQRPRLGRPGNPGVPAPRLSHRVHRHPHRPAGSSGGASLVLVSTTGSFPMSTAQNAVTSEPGNGSATIRARVGDSAIDKVTRLFSAGLADIFTETLQNSRRGGANRVAATIEQDGDATRVTLTDDGAGIADPAVLLTFGESAWKDGIAEAEDPAGFGLLALSRRGCTLRWRVPGEDPSPGFRLVLEPAHFLGRDAAHVVPDDSAPWPHGTAVTFEASEAPHAVRAVLETAARHYPLPVTIDGEVIERRAFLDGALHVEPWKGLVFGVFKDRHAGYRVPDVNFHGLTLPVRLPQIDTVEGGVWSARADIDSCPDLELVLPARKEAVETPFLEEMRDAARLAVYRAMAQADPAPRVAWTDWHKAKEAAIDMPEPPAELRSWRPAIADTDYWDERSAFAGVGTGTLVMQADPEPPEAQALHRALDPAGLQGGSKPALRLFAPEPRFEGYPWYDTLARLTGIETLVTVDGAVRSLDYFTSRENACEPERPETIVMHLNVLHPPKSPRHCFRKCDTIAVPADLAFAGEAWSSLHDALPLVTADSGIAPEELARLLRAAYFSPSDDADADSWETQLTRFEEDALHMSLKLMCSVEEARQRTIADAVWREIFWLMPRDRTVTIVVRGGKVSVDIGPVCTEAATDAVTGEAAQ